MRRGGPAIFRGIAFLATRASIVVAAGEVESWTFAMATTKKSTLWLYRDYDYHLVRWHGRNPPRKCSDLALDGECVDNFCAIMFEALTDIQFPDDAMT
jgi:hypothetical protein